MSERPSWDSAKGFIFNRLGEVMIAHRVPRNLLHPRMPRADEDDLPGGRRKRTDRSPEETFLRETLEEIGHDARILDLMGIVTGPTRNNPGRQRTTYVFAASLSGLEPRPVLYPDPHEHSALSWLWPDKVPESSLPEKYKRLLAASPDVVARATQELVMAELVAFDPAHE